MESETGFEQYFREYWEQFGHEILINEGLIYSHPVDSTVGLIKKHFPQWSFNYIKQSTSFTIFVDKLKYPDLYPVDKLLNELNNFGWFVVNIEYKGKINYKGKFDESKLEVAYNSPFVDNFTLFCEAKYDLLISNYPDKLYHITNIDLWDKIQKNGLTPKSGEKLSNHPERIYLANSVENAEKLAIPFHNMNRIKKSTQKYIPSNKYLILEIDTTKLDDWFRLYQDPNYIGRGYYTLNTINPWSIRIIKEITI